MTPSSLILPAFPAASPDDVLDYAFTFTPLLLPGDAIVAASVTAAPPGLSIAAPVVATPAPVARITGGAPGTAYVLTCTATTAAGRVLAARAVLRVGPIGLDDPALATPLPQPAS